MSDFLDKKGDTHQNLTVSFQYQKIDENNDTDRTYGKSRFKKIGQTNF